MSKADIDWYDPNRKLEWDISNMTGVQTAVRGKAQQGAYLGKALAMRHFATGELASGIRVERDRFRGGKWGVTDWLVVFEHEAMPALEYGHILRGMYAHSQLKHVDGIFVVHDTFKAMGGENYLTAGGF